MTGLDVFDQSLQKTNLILGDIEKKYRWENRRRQAYAGLRAVLHALRDGLTAREAAHFSAQLPLMLKGVFFDQWDPERAPMKMHKEEFIQHIRKEFPFDIEVPIEDFIADIFTILEEHMDPGEFEKIKLIVPKDIADLM